MKEDKKKNLKKKQKDCAIVNARNLKISAKFSMAICNMIRGKTTEEAIKMLEEVILFKRPVKMNNRQVGHKHGKGVMAGCYPINCCKEFIRLIKQLNANAIVNEFPIEEGVLSCKADVGSRQYRRMGERFKSANINLKIEKPKIKRKN